ncbi:MAG: Qat anti-phage system associated protein QatB [Phycisphaerales bacterium]
MKLGVGHYFNRGLGGGGGGGSATARFGGTASTAGRLYGALSGLAGGATSRGEAAIDPSVLESRDVSDVVRAVVDAVRPVDGTQDAEASREAIGEALAELLKQDPDADLQQLTDDQRLVVVQEFIARDIFHRLVLDVGGAIKARAANARVYLKRLDQIRSYLRQGIAAAFRRLAAASHSVTRSRVAALTRKAIADAISVFEEYIA